MKRRLRLPLFLSAFQFFLFSGTFVPLRAVLLVFLILRRLFDLYELPAALASVAVPPIIVRAWRSVH